MLTTSREETLFITSSGKTGKTVMLTTSPAAFEQLRKPVNVRVNREGWFT
jgi:hypothetical protein